MQTFLPYDSFRDSAACLDRQRLGKQRVEVVQILNALAGESKGWVNHPATRMWRGYEMALVEYGLAVCDEWISRGYHDNCRKRIAELAINFVGNTGYPPWLGDPDFHESHQSNLVRKDPEHYREFFPDVSPDMNYVWPV